MLGRKIDGAKPVSLPHVRAILEQRSGEPDFGYEQQTSLEYARKFAKLTPADADKLAGELAEFDTLKPETITKIVDILPAHLSTLQAVLLKDRITLAPDKLTKVLELIAKFRTKMVEPPEPKVEGEHAPIGGEPEEAPAAEAEKSPAKAEDGDAKKSKSSSKAKEKAAESQTPLDASAAEGQAAKELVKSSKGEKEATAEKSEKSEKAEKAPKEKAAKGEKAKKEKVEASRAK